MINKHFPDATHKQIDDALELASSCFVEFSKKKGSERSNFLNCIAFQLESKKNMIVEVADNETRLGNQRLISELNRTVLQIREFARLAETGHWREQTIEKGEPNRLPIPKPDMAKENIPIGPVVVIGACNFPIAISVVGTDTSSALAVGCPVVVKSHPKHAYTCQILADIVNIAKKETGMPDGCFSLHHGINHSVTARMVSHRKTSAVAFTGSLKGGRELSKIASTRNHPIPFYAEMGSINPVFALPGALLSKGGQFANGYIKAVNLFAGQMCTKPGILILLKESYNQEFVTAIKASVARQENLPMLNPDVFRNFEDCSKLHRTKLSLVAESQKKQVLEKQTGQIQIFRISGNEFLDDPEIQTEAFGPSSIIVIAETKEEMIELAKSMEGSLTGSILIGENDDEFVRQLYPILESKVGRLLWNDFPPGVTPGIATHHGGPWPASTDARFTSIGIQGYKRFIRSICRQGFATSGRMP
jgi:NADP-dependent aldehyde dehydrogenase